MGSMAPSPPPPPQLMLADLKALSVLGSGARSVVFHVVPTTAAATAGGCSGVDPMALKAISRAAARHKSAAGPGPGGARGGDGHRRIWFERDVLLALHHPLLPSLRGVVATDAIIGFAIDRCAGGDLNSLRRRQAGRAFSDTAIRFYAAELVLALEHLHGLGIAYRDLKPENVLIQGSGHIMLVDFDLSTALPLPPPPAPPDTTPLPPSSSPSHSSRHRKRNNNRKAVVFGCFSSRRAASTESSSSQSPPPSTSRTASFALSSSCRSSSARTPAKSNSFVGTEDYVAPEIVAGSGHDYAVDWWGLGVVLYEMLYGRTPFRGRSLRETFHRVLTARPELPGEPTPLRDLIARLLEKDPGKRLGAHGVKRHAFFHGVDWDRVLGVARPPFIPTPDDGSTGADAEAEAEALDVEKVVREVFASSAGGKTVAEEKAAPVVGGERGRDSDFSVFF